MDFLHVEVGLAEILGGLELLGLLYVKIIEHTLVSCREITRSLTCKPAGRHISNLSSRNEIVKYVREPDGNSAPCATGTGPPYGRCAHAHSR